MRRYVWMFGIWCVCVVLQNTVFAQLSWGAVKPDLVMLWSVLIALHHRPGQGVVIGAVLGLLTDFYLSRYFGIYIVTLPLVAFLSGSLQQNWYRENIPLTILMAFILSATGQSCIAALTTVGGAYWPLGDALAMIAGVALYNALLTPLIYPFMHKAFTQGFLRERKKWDHGKT